MTQSNLAARELAYLLKLLPALHDLASVDRVQRLMLALAAAGRDVGFERAVMFSVDRESESIRGLFGVDRPADGPRVEGPRTFEQLARDAFTLYEHVDATDTTLKAKAFNVPLAWHRSALVKSVLSGYPVLADQALGEYATDPFFEFFGTARYVAVPIRVDDRVTAVLAADDHGSKDVDADRISVLYSLCQQGGMAAARHIHETAHRRRMRILWKLHQALGESDDPERFAHALKLVMIMIVRAVRGRGAVLRDLVRQKTVHIQDTQDTLPAVDEPDMTAVFDELLDRATGRMEPFSGDATHELLDGEPSGISSFFAAPLSSGDDSVGAVVVYRQGSDNALLDADERSFIQLCSGIIAVHLEGHQKQRRADRADECLSELSTTLARERDRARLGERSIEYSEALSSDIERLSEEISSRLPYAKRFPRIARIVESMRENSRTFDRSVGESTNRYRMTDLFEVVREVVDEWQATLSERNIEVTVRIPASGPRLLVDRKRMATAVRYILNTTAASLIGGEQMLVECSKTREHGVICVADNGHGVPGDALTRLFLPFEAKADDRQRALSLAGQIIQKHAGDIAIKSSRSWRTILVLSLPLAANRDRRKTPRDRRNRGDRRATVHS